jgi:hypothetical protein
VQGSMGAAEGFGAGAEPVSVLVCVQFWMPWNYRAGRSVDESDPALGVKPPIK